MAKSTSTALPPGPPGRWRPTLRLIHDARGAFREWSQKYGDPFYLHALNGPVVITGRPELIKQIFSHDPLAYDAFAERALRPMLGSGSLLLLNGERHRRERKLVMPLFHGDRMRSYAAIMQQAALDAMENRPQNTAFDMLDATTEISLSVIVQAVFGGEQAEATRRMIDLAQATVRRSLPIFFFSPKLHIKFFGLSPWDKFLRSRADLRSALQAELRRRKEQPAEREDILSLMTEAQYEDGSPIALDDALDELGTFLFAGHETSAIALAWAIYHLHHNPPTLQRLEQELQAAGEVTGETLAKLPYLKAVVQETLRLHPIVTEVLRVLKSPMELDGYQLPAGTAVAPAAALAHYNEQTFPQPDQFSPQRFLERSYSSSEYLPFGGGHRRCIGAAFAQYEMAIVLGTILSRYTLRLLEESPVKPKRRNVTMGPSTGIRVLFHKK